MFRWNRDEELTSYYIYKMLSEYATHDLPRMTKWKEYYDGEQEILKRTYTDKSRQASNTVTNFCFNIATNYVGYMVGKPITYSIEEDEDDKILDILKYNDYMEQDNGMLSNALVYGVSNELMYIDYDKNIRFDSVSPLCSFGLFSNDCEEELLYFLRWWKRNEWDDDQTYNLDVYDKATVKHYTMLGMGGGLELKGEEPHFFTQVPANVFYMPDERSVFDCIMTLQDAYNDATSDTVDNLNYFADQYMVMKGCTIPGDTEEEKISNAQLMRKNRIFELPATDSSMEFLNKSGTEASNSENILARLQTSIYRIACCPDFSSESFGNASSGVALKYKLSSIENRASHIEARMKKALQRRIELICSFVGNVYLEDIWEDVNIIFNRNIPTDVNEVATLINSLSNVVSTRTLFEHIPYVEDINAEMEEVAREKNESLNMYLDFNPNEIEENNEEDTEKDEENLEELQEDEEKSDN